MNKLLVITGPTASGKTAVGIDLAKKFDGEILSADSRQVYRFMDIGTGKDREEYEKAGVKVWGIDLVDPDYPFNVSDFVKYATSVIADVRKRGKVPIIVGGTVLYIKALLEPFETIDVPRNEILRNELENLSLEDLQKRLGENLRKMNASDQKNPRRLVRAIEVASGRKGERVKHEGREMDAEIIVLTASLSEIYERIDARVDKRIDQGIENEINKLLRKGYGWELASMSATGYREFRNGFTSEAIQRWKFDEHGYARRQVTFLRKFIKEQNEAGRIVVELDSKVASVEDFDYIGDNESEEFETGQSGRKG